MNEVNGAPVLSLAQYVCCCCLGRRPRGSSLSSDRRKREISSMSPSSTRSVVTLLNDQKRVFFGRLATQRHDCATRWGRLHPSRPLQMTNSVPRHSAFKSEMLHPREPLAKRIEYMSHGRYLQVEGRQSTTTVSGYISASRRYTSTIAISSKNLNLALLNLRLFAVFINCRRCGREIESSSRSLMLKSSSRVLTFT